MRIFLDSSVILSACGSEKSLSRLVTEISAGCGWELISSEYCRAETARNVGKFGELGVRNWKNLRARLHWVASAFTSDRPLLLAASKDKPVLISALAAESHVLLTLDTGDFEALLGTKVYGLLVTTPRNFLVSQGLG